MTPAEMGAIRERHARDHFLGDQVGDDVSALLAEVDRLRGVLEALRDEECACMGWGGGSDCCAVRSQDEAARALDGEA